MKYLFLMLIPLLFTGCVTKMIGGAVSVVTFGLVEEDNAKKVQKITKKEVSNS